MNRVFSGIAVAAALLASTFTAVSARADDLEKIKAAGELKISMSGQYPPFNFVNDQN